MLLDDLVTLVDDIKNSVPSKQSDEKEKIEQGALLVREMAMKTMKRRQENTESEIDSKKKQATDNRRNSIAAAIEADSEREFAVKEKELEYQRFRLESELKQCELDRQERKAERAHQLALAQIESEKMLNLMKAFADGKK
ncbi:hypothetical protein AeMF1_013193 [Aphanomyces euteiches]|nr:hypothetical protein AeMF1_013193 [Aphanomyces euteiches]KAH9130442.1 hypothetical protein AeNC1_019816 [Aphanomyces euteiches]